MSAAELARLTGIKQSTLARRMTGETAFDLDDLELIADALQVDVADLLPRSVGAGVAAQTGLNKNLAPLNLPFRNDHVRAVPARAIAPPRRESVRPVSAVPATRRRPTTMRPAKGPMAK